ncbi:MAG: hypothetical protein HC914_17580 [Chloroflexaceae bacterium]|nr:hypothetical protein [Chloroflexaceae bacterium]
MIGMIRWCALVLCASCLLLLVACAEQVSAPPPAAPLPTVAPTTPAPAVATSAAAGPTPTEAVPPLPTPTPLPMGTLTNELTAYLQTQVPPVAAEPDAIGTGITSVRAISIENTIDDRPLWLAYSLGKVNPVSDTYHFVALYTYHPAAPQPWQELERESLETVEVLDDWSGINQAWVVPERIWIEVKGGVGAHSGVYVLLSFDGTSLRREVTATHSSPAGAGRLHDINSDGTPEVLINQTDEYVYCYACGIREVSYSFMRWNGTTMEPVALAPLSATMPPDLANLNNEAIAHAEVGLWKDAHHLAQQAAALNATTGNPTVRLNVGIITTIAEGRAAAMLPNTLLPYVFYGDYAAATAYMAGHPVEALFLPPDQNPLIVGTPAEGWPPQCWRVSRAKPCPP